MASALPGITCVPDVSILAPFALAVSKSHFLGHTQHDGSPDLLDQLQTIAALDGDEGVTSRTLKSDKQAGLAAQWLDALDRASMAAYKGTRTKNPYNYLKLQRFHFVWAL